MTDSNLPWKASQDARTIPWEIITKITAGAVTAANTITEIGFRRRLTFLAYSDPSLLQTLSF